MKAIVMVTEDTTGKWEFDGKSGTSRTLTCVDQDPDHRLIPAFLVRIDVKDPIAGDGEQGASLKDASIELAITDINQREHNKRLTFVGRPLRILGQMKMVPWKAETDKKAA